MLPVNFYFPDEYVTHLTIRMDHIPRQGDEICFGFRPSNEFDTREDFERFQEEDYTVKTWRVKYVCWIFDDIHYQVNIELVEAQPVETTVLQTTLSA